MMLADKLRMVSVLLLFGPCVARVLAADGSGKGEMPPQAPIIGILSQPLMAPNGTNFNVTYFPMSYPEYAAMGGARTVAVLCDTPVAELKDLYHSINGLIVPGAHMTTDCSVMWCQCRWTKLHDNLCMTPCAPPCSRHGTCGTIASKEKKRKRLQMQLGQPSSSCCAARLPEMGCFSACAAQQSDAEHCHGAAFLTRSMTCSTARPAHFLLQAQHAHEYAGGAQDLRPGNCYYDAMAHIMDWAMADFDLTKEVFPIHFTCLGWEAVAVKVTQNPYILGSFYSFFLSHYYVIVLLLFIVLVRHHSASI